MAGNIKYSNANQACCPDYTVVLLEGCEEFVQLPPGTLNLNIWNGNNSYAALTFYIDEVSGGGAFPTTFTVTANGVANTVQVLPGGAVTRVFTNITTVTISTRADMVITGKMCYRIYDKKSADGESSCCLPSPCCTLPTLVVDNFIDTFFVRGNNAPTNTIWIDNASRTAKITVFLYPDSTSNATIIINLEGGGTITYDLIRGESRTDIVPNVLSIVVNSNPNQIEFAAQGEICISVNRKIY